MRALIEYLAFGYLVLLIMALMIGTGTRMTGDNCKVVVADYVFLGLTRLPCEVGK